MSYPSDFFQKKRCHLLRQKPMWWTFSCSTSRARNSRLGATFMGKPYHLWPSAIYTFAKPYGLHWKLLEIDSCSEQKRQQDHLRLLPVVLFFRPDTQELTLFQFVGQLLTLLVLLSRLIIHHHGHCMLCMWMLAAENRCDSPVAQRKLLRTQSRQELQKQPPGAATANVLQSLMASDGPSRPMVNFLISAEQKRSLKIF